MSQLNLHDVVTFWTDRQSPGADGCWRHCDDRAALAGAQTFGFNLDHPVSPYIGNILDAPVIILNLNGGYDAIRTPREFAQSNATSQLLARVADPRRADWTAIPSYYHDANYGAGLLDGRFAAINVCAYRSPNLQDAKARTLADRLPSVRFHRRWLAEAVLPLVQAGQRLVIAHRWGLWKIPAGQRSLPGLLFDLKCRAFVNVDEELLEHAVNFVKG